MPLRYMDDLDKFGEISSPEKENFYSHLNTEDITDVVTFTQKELVKIFK